jgi:hypothetical protein
MAKPATAAAGTNDYDGKAIDAFLKKIMGKHDELDSLAGGHMKRCQTVRKGIAGLIEEAKAKGVPKRIMRLQVEIELGKRRLKAKMTDLEREDQLEARLVAEARKDSVQMSLFGWTAANRPTKDKIKAARAKVAGKTPSLTDAPKPDAAKPKADAKKDGKADDKGDGSDLTANGKAPAGVTGAELKGDEFKEMHPSSTH